MEHNPPRELRLEPGGPLRRAGRTVRLVVISVLVLLFAVPPGIRFGTNWLWFTEIGFESVLLKEITTKVILFTVVGPIAFLVLWLNLRRARRSVELSAVLLPDVPPAALDLIRRVSRIVTPVSVVVAAMFGISAAAGWLNVLQFIHRTPFGVTDPVLGRDVGFYVFVLPTVGMVLSVIISLVVFSALFSAFLYFLGGEIGLRQTGLRVTQTAGAHLGTLIAIYLVLSVLNIWFVELPSLLTSDGGRFVGASYTDLNARRPGFYLSSIAAIGGAIAIVVGIMRRRVLPYAAVALASYVGVGLLARIVFPAAIQRLVVAPTELTRERPYIVNHVAATRRAWGLDSVQTRDLDGAAGLTLADVRANSATIENVRLWDREPLLQTFGQLQEIRTYYDFVSVDDDRYMIDGRYRQVLLSPRELNVASLPTRSFINDHLTFTHGMGVTLAPVNQVQGEGLPVLFIKDLPPASSVSLANTRPQIYYGELTNEYAIVATRQQEFDYPSGEANIFAEYKGSGGVHISSFARRALLAWRFQSLKILLSGDITDSSRILYHRNVVERARKALPFLRLDGDPYMVLTDSGSLQWVLDAYTTSSRYPYSARLTDGTSYMRNSAKIVVDAYHGSVKAYIADAGDPIITTFARAFPSTLQPLDSMPADLRRHVRYPEDLYRAQTALYTIYHLTEPDAFYHREDQWQIPVLDQGERNAPFMRRIVMRLPDEENAEFIFMTPFTPRQKDNLAAWMVARSDSVHYGKLMVYRFPKQSLVFGPRQIVNRINQDTEIARQITLWDQRGSEVIRGELLVIPIEESLLYVQPLYLRAEGGQIPELKRVIVAYQNRVVMEERLDAALARLFGGSVPETRAEDRPRTTPSDTTDFVPTATTGPAGTPAATAEVIRQLRDHFDRATAAQRAGNWAEYGVQMERLGALLRAQGQRP
jgi:uncharacterized membrane protein (UPF0182 family)